MRDRLARTYLLGLELTDTGFDFTILSDFRARLVARGAEYLLLEALLERCTALGLVTPRGKLRTDSTHVLAAVRALNTLVAARPRGARRPRGRHQLAALGRLVNPHTVCSTRVSRCAALAA